MFCSMFGNNLTCRSLVISFAIQKKENFKNSKYSIEYKFSETSESVKSDFESEELEQKI